MGVLATNRSTSILGLQRRMAQVGRIRLGEKKHRAEGQRPVPAKLSKFRLTSKDPQRLEAAASIYGGTVREWDDPSSDDRFELYTQTDALDIAVVPGQAITQAMELWGQEHPKGTKPNPVICLRRCDGQTCQVPAPNGRRGTIDVACPCAALDEPECKVTTRISVILSRIPGLGVWRLDTHGWNAAAELVGNIELLETMTAANAPTRARLCVEMTTEVTRRGTFVYPKPRLDIDHTVDEILAIAEGARQHALGAGGAAVPALPAPSFTRVPDRPHAPVGSIEDQLATAGAPRPENARASTAEPIRATGLPPRPAHEVPAAGVEAAEEGAAEGDTDPAGGPDAASPGRRTMSPAQRVAMWAKDAGLDDDGRHHFLAAFSDGAYSSAKDVPEDRMTDLRAALIALHEGDVELVEADGSWSLGRTTGERTLPPRNWSDEVARTPGVGEAKFLSAAKRIANERLGADRANTIVGYDTVPDAITNELLAWLADRRGEAR